MRAFAIVLALADDFMPTDWRGDPLSVMAEWDFVADFNPYPMEFIDMGVLTKYSIRALIDGA